MTTSGRTPARFDAGPAVFGLVHLVAHAAQHRPQLSRCHPRCPRPEHAAGDRRAWLQGPGRARGRRDAGGQTTNVAPCPTPSLAALDVAPVQLDEPPDEGQAEAQAALAPVEVAIAWTNRSKMAASMSARCRPRCLDTLRTAWPSLAATASRIAPPRGVYFEALP